MGEWVCVAGLFYYSIYFISQDPSLCVYTPMSGTTLLACF